MLNRFRVHKYAIATVLLCLAAARPSRGPAAHVRALGRQQRSVVVCFAHRHTHAHESWSVAQVLGWLQSLELGDHAAAFVAASVDGAQ